MPELRTELFFSLAISRCSRSHGECCALRILPSIDLLEAEELHLFCTGVALVIIFVARKLLGTSKNVQ